MSKQTELAQLGNAVTVDSSGRVYRSTIPSWRLGLSADQNESSSGSYTVEFDKSSTQNCFIAGGCTLSAGVITVPVAGLYFISSTVRFNNVSSSYYLILRSVKNGSMLGSEDTYVIVDDHGSSYHTMTITDLFQCNAGDTLEMSGYVQLDSSWGYDADTSHFNGYMVG